MRSVLSFFLLACLQLVAKISGNDKVDPGKPLFLTPYLEKGSIDQARRLSVVGPLPGLNPSQQPTTYSGYFTINKSYGSNMFFWFTPAQLRHRDAPIILWLQGGPGSSSLFGLFLENGPFMLDENSKVTLRKATLQKYFNMIYVDEPIGAGYSFTTDDKGYARTSEEAADDLYIFLQQFFQMFPEYRHNDFYVAGESYGGKIATIVVGRLLLTQPSPLARNLNLKGLIHGVSSVNLHKTINPSAVLYQMGLVDTHGFETVSQRIFKMNENMEAGCSKCYIDKLLELIAFELSSNPSVYQNLTGCNYVAHIMFSHEPKQIKRYSKFVQDLPLRRSLHVGSDTPFTQQYKIVEHLFHSFMEPADRYLEIALNSYKVLAYVGQMDAVFPFVNTETFIRSLTWENKDEFLKAKRTVWRTEPPNSEVRGYVTKAGNFTLATVRYAGHTPGMNNQIAAVMSDLFYRFVYDVSFDAV